MAVAVAVAMAVAGVWRGRMSRSGGRGRQAVVNAVAPVAPVAPVVPVIAVDLRPVAEILSAGTTVHRAARRG
jgi:hypothetical protein